MKAKSRAAGLHPKRPRHPHRPVLTPMPASGPRLGTMAGYAHAEAGIQKLILIRNHLGVLCRLFEDGMALSLTLRYSALHPVQFLDAYEGFMGALHPRQQEQVLCAADLISDLHRRRGALKKVRNSRIAHIPVDGLFAEYASTAARRVGPPVDSAAHYEMLMCAAIFIDTVRALPPCIAKPAAEKFRRAGDAKPKLHRTDFGQIAHNTRSKMDSVQEMAGQKFFDMQRLTAKRRWRLLGPDRARRPRRLHCPQGRVVQRESGTPPPPLPPVPRPCPNPVPECAAAGVGPPRRPVGLPAPGRPSAEKGGEPSA